MTASKSAGATLSGARLPLTLPAFSIRRYLFWLIGGVILVSGVLVAVTLAHLRGVALRAAERLTASFAQVIAEQTGRTFQTIDQRLQLAEVTVRRLDAAGPLTGRSGRDAMREEIKELPFVRALSVTDAKGRVVYSSEAALLGGSGADRAYFQRYQKDPSIGFQIGTPVRGPATQEWLIPATRPLFSTGGAFSGLMVAAVDPAYFALLWRTVDLGGPVSLALFRRDGVLMTQSPFEDALVGKSYPKLAVFGTPFDASPAGLFHRNSVFDGAATVFAYRVLPSHPELVVVLGKSHEHVLASWRQLSTFSLLVWGTASLALVAFAGFLNRIWQQRARTEAQVEQMAQRLVLATDAASIGVWDWDLKADRWYATPTYFAMLGYEPDQGVGRRQDWLDQVHPEDRELVAANIQAALAGADVPYRHDARVRHADGSFRWMSVVGRVLARDEAGKPSRLLGAMVDITENKRSEQALRESEAFSRSILDSVGVEIAVLDHDGVILAVNEPWNRFARENGPGAGNLLRADPGCNYLTVCDEVEGPEAKDAASAALGIRGVSNGTSTVFRLDYACHSPSEQRWFTLSATPLGPNRQGAVIAHVNITERMRAAEALRLSIREKEALLKEVHHRVKNNLQVITSLLRLETSRSREGDTRSVLREMQSRVRSMALLHETLYKTGKFARVDVADYLRQLATQLFRALNTAPGVRLELDLRSMVVDIDQAIPCGLIVNELITNSLKHAFGTGRGEVRVACGPDPDRQARIEVDDSGAGLPPDFETRRSASLGLQLVSDLARQLGGTLEVGPDSAARFAVTFPLRHFETGPIVLTAG